MKKTIILTSLSLLTVIISSSVVDARALIKDQQVAVQKFNLKADADVAVKVIPIPMIWVDVENKEDNIVLRKFKLEVEKNADNMILNGFELEAGGGDINLDEIKVEIEKPIVEDVFVAIDQTPIVLVVDGEDVTTIDANDLDIIVEVDADIEFE